MRKRMIHRAGAAALFLSVVFFTLIFFFGAREVELVSESVAGSVAWSAPALPESPLTGLPCEDAARRPLAVMLAADPATRPLSGIAEADLVIEMPVTMNQITRLMALYQCAHPTEIGSVRSARHDFLPLAAGFDAVYAHWGGSHFALETLSKKVLDDIDALVNPFNAYWRKKGILAPHNGFTSHDQLWRAATSLGYRAVVAPKILSGFRHQNIVGEHAYSEAMTITIPYASPGFDVRWQYEPERRIYTRFRSGQPEKDKNEEHGVGAAAVIVMHTTQTHLESEYTDVKVVGSGHAIIYQGGAMVPARWQKENFSAPLRFVDDSGADISFVPGKKWIEIVVK